MNLAAHATKTNRRPQVGDLFALKLTDGPFLFGRVVAVDARPLGISGGVLIYVYRDTHREKIEIPATDPSTLLIPPLITNTLPWSRGYFEHIEHIPLAAHEVRTTHAFWDCMRKVFRNEYGEVLSTDATDAGIWGLHSFKTIDDAVSQALGIPLSVD